MSVMEKTKSGYWYRECWRLGYIGISITSHLKDAIRSMLRGYRKVGKGSRKSHCPDSCSCSYCYSSCNDPFWLPRSSNSDVYNFRPKSSRGIPPWLCSITEPQKALSWAVSFLQRPWIYQYFIWMFLIKFFLSILFLTVTQVLDVWAGRQSWTPPSYA